MDLIAALVQGFWVIIPAYAANGFAPLPRGRRRIDFGMKFMGYDLLGRGKTWEGLIFAVFIGTLCGITEIWAYPYLNPIAMENGFSLQKLTFWSVFFVALGAMLGDMAGSFIKRRFRVKRGDPVLLLDQLDFLIGGFLFASFFLEVSLLSIIIFIIITPIVHWVSCYIGYKIGAKEVPW